MTRDNHLSLPQYVLSLKPTFWGKFFYYCLPFRKRTIIDNMHIAFGDTLNQNQIVILAKAYYSHIATTLKELFSFKLKSENNLKSIVRIEGVEHVTKALEKDKGLLLLTGHLGNWEVVPVAGIKQFELLKGRFYFLRKNIRVKWIENLLFRRFYQAGLQVIAGKNRLDKAYEALEKKSALVFVMDQHVNTREKGSKEGVLVPFFKKQAGTYRSLAILHGHTKAPLLAVTTYRNNDGTHVLKFSREIERLHSDSYKEEIRINTEQYNRVLEQLIMEHPEQWHWMHRRWKASHQYS